MRSEFDPAEFDERYDFKDGRVHRKGSNRRLVHHVNPRTGYAFYRLTRNDGKRVSISKEIVSGSVEKVGDLYYVSRTPKDTTTNTEFPAYAFDHKHKVIWRVAFAAPRRKYVRVTPNKVGKVKLRDFSGRDVWKHVDDIFA